MHNIVERLYDIILTISIIAVITLLLTYRLCLRFSIQISTTESITIPPYAKNCRFFGLSVEALLTNHLCFFTLRHARRDCTRCSGPLLNCPKARWTLQQSQNSLTVRLVSVGPAALVGLWVQRSVAASPVDSILAA